MSSTTASDIAIVLTRLLSNLEAEKAQAYADLQEVPELKAAAAAAREGRLFEFRIQLLRPFEQIVDGLLAVELPGTESTRGTVHQLRFLAKHSDFVERHFRSVIERHEGSACCADKTRTIIKRLFAFLSAGTPIVFNYDAAYTFHLPTKVFREHEQVLSYFTAIYRLYHGRTEELVAALADIETRATAA